jgi:hypothetical protein
LRTLRSTYNRWKYATELAAAMERVAGHIIDLSEGRRRGAVVRGPWSGEKV